jgi:hypothetical protein
MIEVILDIIRKYTLFLALNGKGAKKPLGFI